MIIAKIVISVNAEFREVTWDEAAFFVWLMMILMVLTKHVLVFRKPILLIYKKVGIWSNHLWVVMETDLSKIPNAKKGGFWYLFDFYIFFSFEKRYQTYYDSPLVLLSKRWWWYNFWGLRFLRPPYFSSTFVYPKFDNELEQIKHCRYHKVDTNPNFSSEIIFALRVTGYHPFSKVRWC